MYVIFTNLAFVQNLGSLCPQAAHRRGVSWNSRKKVIRFNVIPKMCKNDFLDHQFRDLLACQSERLSSFLTNVFVKTYSACWPLIESVDRIKLWTRVRMRKVCFNLPVMFLERYLWKVNENNKSKVILVPKIVSALNLMLQKITTFWNGSNSVKS